MQIFGLDHLVLTVKDIEVTKKFYQSVLGMDIVSFNGGRLALKFGTQKINLHQSGNEFIPAAMLPTPGSADLCFLTDTPLHEAIAHVRRLDVEVEEGPIERTGATGSLLSFYIRDPDHNLLEISNRINV